MSDVDPAAPDPAAQDADAEAWLAKLETLRRSVDLRLDAEGRWHHDGEPFEHPGLIAAFDRGIDTHPETGEPILRLGGRWCYIRADDSPYVVRRLRLDGDTLRATLNTGDVIDVPDAGLEQTGDHLYLPLAHTARAGRARLDRTAQARLAEWLVADGDRLAIEAAGRRWPVT